jgi:hypothetical protein
MPVGRNQHTVGHSKGGQDVKRPVVRQKKKIRRKMWIVTVKMLKLVTVKKVIPIGEAG